MPSSKSSPHTARSRELFAPPHRGVETKRSAGDTVKQTMVRPGTFSDGQDRMGTRPENVHRDERPHYMHKDSLAYRADQTSSPSVPTHHKPVPPEVGFNGNVHEYVRRGKR